MTYWLFKTEPDTFSWSDLLKSPRQIAGWEGVRNYQARNFLRDQVKLNDLVFFYHSSTEPTCIAGIVRVVRAGYPDHHAWNPESHYFDPKSTPDNPRWYMVDITPVRGFEPHITREELKRTAGLEEMMLLQRGSRLSIQPVTAEEWRIIEALRPE